jgi:hypothetical protein
MPPLNGVEETLVCATPLCSQSGAGSRNPRLVARMEKLSKKFNEHIGSNHSASRPKALQFEYRGRSAKKPAKLGTKVDPTRSSHPKISVATGR